MTDKEIRLECLKLSILNYKLETPKEVVDLAHYFAEFIIANNDN